jgi:RHS repeat-associated protein
MADVVFQSVYWPNFKGVPRGSIYEYRDAGNRVVTEYWDGTLGRDNVFLGNLLVASNVTSALAGTVGRQFYHSDHLGSPRLVTNLSAATVEQRKYWPFGDDATAPSTSQRLRFATIERDTETSTHHRYYDHARFVETKWGRFLGPDKVAGFVEVPQSLNRYAYAAGNPLGLIDADGRSPKLAAGIILGAGEINGFMRAGTSGASTPEAIAQEFCIGFVSGSLGAAAGITAAALGPVGAGAVGGAVEGVAAEWLEMFFDPNDRFSSKDVLESALAGGVAGKVALAVVPKHFKGGRLPDYWATRTLDSLFSRPRVNEVLRRDLMSSLVSSGGSAAL